MKRNFFLWFRETEVKRSETVSVLLSFALKQNFLKAKLGHPSGEGRKMTAGWGGGNLTAAGVEDDCWVGRGGKRLLSGEG